MVQSITKKQAIYLLLICMIGTKFQRLPSFLTDVSGKGFWVVLMIYLLVDALFLMITFRIINLGNGASLYEMIENSVGKVVAKLILIILAFYFFMLAVLPYESVQEVFADVIFDSLPWKYFALFLIITMAVIAVSGLRNIGRVCQLFFYVVAIGVVGLFILGASSSDISKVLPIADITISAVGDGVLRSSLWFGNFMILFVLMGKIEKQEDKKFGGFYLSFFIGTLFVAATFIVFYGIYEYITPLKRNLLTKISQFSLLSLDIGRPDWFLIMFGEIATILTAGIFIFCSATCTKQVLGLEKPNYVIYGTLLLMYLTTIFLFKSKLIIFRIFTTYGAWFGIFVQYLLPLILLIIACNYHKKLSHRAKPKKQKNKTLKKRQAEAEL